jgi:MFS family permease
VPVRSPSRRWPLLALLTTTYAGGAFGVLGVSPLAPILLEAFGITRLQVGLLLPAIYIGGVVFSLPGGRLADDWGVRATLATGLGLVGAALVGAAVAPGYAAFLAALAVAGIGWALVNPALGAAILQIFPVSERGLAMGIKQMGLMVGGIASALVLPGIAGGWGWRAALGVCAALSVVPAASAWRVLADIAPREPAGVEGGRRAGAGTAGLWWWARRPPLLVLFGSGFGFGMLQSAVLGYLPLFSIQALGFTTVGAGALLAAAQAGGAVARVALGAASDRWLAGQRSPCLVLTAGLTALVFLACAWRPEASPWLVGITAFAAGVGTFGWVGVFLVASAEAGGARQAGLLTGVGMAFIVSGILVGAPAFGAVLEATNSYGAAWTAFAALAATIGVALQVAGPRIAWAIGAGDRP